jgi:hypothetical protein
MCLREGWGGGGEGRMRGAGGGGDTDACELPQRFICVYGVIDGVPPVAVAGDAPGVTQRRPLRSIPVVPDTQRIVNLPARAVERISQLAQSINVVALVASQSRRAAADKLPSFKR